MFASCAPPAAGRWLAVGAAALMAGDNLAARPRADRDARHLRAGGDDLGGGAVPAKAAAAAGAVLGVGACIKLVAPYVLRRVRVARAAAAWLRARPRSAGRGSRRLAALRGRRGGRRVRRAAGDPRPDRAAVRRRPAEARPPAARSATSRTSSATRRTRPARTGRRGSPPTRGSGWSTSSRSVPEHQPGTRPARAHRVHPAVHFLGMISPPILLLALPALHRGGGARPATRRRLRRVLAP